MPRNQAGSRRTAGQRTTELRHVAGPVCRRSNSAHTPPMPSQAPRLASPDLDKVRPDETIDASAARPLHVSFPQKVCVHDPSLARLGFGSHSFNVLRELTEISREQDFILGANISAPIDFHIGIVDRLE